MRTFALATVTRGLRVILAVIIVVVATAGMTTISGSFALAAVTVGVNCL